MYESSLGWVRTSDGVSGTFEFSAGVKQGCCLSPFLFIVVLDFILRRAIDSLLGVCLQKAASRRPRTADAQAQHVADLGFADGLKLMSGRFEQLQRLIDRVVFEAARVGLGINVGKTAVMSVGVGPVTNPVLLVYGRELTIVTDFCLLSSWMRTTARDVGTRRALAWRAATSLTRIWKSSIANWLKRRLFRALVEPILMDGCEAWTLIAALNKRLDGTYTRLPRFCQRSSSREYMTNIRL